MALETATYISDLVATNPAVADPTGQGDDHLRLLKATLLATFPSITGAVTATHTAINSAAVAAGASGILNIGPGTASLPAFSHSGDPDTGWYNSGANEESLALGGAQKYVFSATKFDALTQQINVSAAANFTVGGVAVFPLQSANIGAQEVLTAAIADANVTYAKIQNVAADRLLGNPTGSPAAVSEISLGAGLAFSGSTLAANAKVPTYQTFLSGTSLTYTTPAGCTLIKVKMVAGGGGGGAESVNAGADGTNSSFGTWTTAHGLGGGVSGNAPGPAGGTGGTNGTGTLIRRQAGQTGGPGILSGLYGGAGGNSALGGGTSIILNGNPAENGAANTGAGGAGAISSGNGGRGGSAGEYVEFYITSPAATYTYTVGAGGNGGAAGVAAGGNGAAGIIMVEEFYG